MSDVWVTSDTHFGHHNIIEFCERPFIDVQDMNNEMLERWNDTVKENDKVYHLGDVYFGGGLGAEYWDEFLPKLHGKKYLALGNHDNGMDQRLRKMFKRIEYWYIFHDIHLMLTHVPLHPESLEQPGTQRNDIMCVHGHTHTLGEPKDRSELYKCVCVEWTNYRPVALEELAELAKARGF